ncbi:hypothetical protein CsSME_00019223 [Camellia sinensis var. sinensis]
MVGSSPQLLIGHMATSTEIPLARCYDPPLEPPYLLSPVKYPQQCLTELFSSIAPMLGGAQFNKDKSRPNGSSVKYITLITLA